MVSTSGSGRIAVDAMGGDLGPAEVVAGVKLALHQSHSLNPITLVGDEGVLGSLIHEAGLHRSSRLSIHHASEIVTMEDKPVDALKRKKDSSMMRAIDLVKSGEARAAVSCGNTGGLIAGGTVKLRTIEGIARPALAAICPRAGGHFVLIDAGGNPEAKSEHLVHNAILGTQYCRLRLGVKSPRVGLMTIGTEEGKGNAVITETNELLKRLGGLVNYKGPIEGFHLFEEHVDVVVCDGFVGNIMIKSWESLVKFFKAVLKEEMTANLLRKTGGFLSKGASNSFKERINPERYGGAPLLGLNGHILKAHGSANRRAIRSAILAASEILKADFNQQIERDVARANELIGSSVLS